MAAQVLRPLITLPAAKWPLRSYLKSLFNSTTPRCPSRDSGNLQFFAGKIPLNFLQRNLHDSRLRALRPVDPSFPSEVSQSDRESDSADELRKSRNEKKREARRAVRWGMELADFNDVEIKRILRVLSLEEEVFDALMMAKRLGRDVREGKRRQFNYIGRLLREVQPELMDGLIAATKDGNLQKFRDVSGSDKLDLGEDDEEDEETDYEDEEEDFDDYDAIATRWFDGLVNKDVKITNEIYSLSSVEFDRQELRRLVRKFWSVQDRHAATDENVAEVEAGLSSAKKSLTLFLKTLAKQLPTDENFIS